MSKISFRLLCALMCIVSVKSSEDLPGLDYLAAGFDALKMISVNEASASDKLKFRLFDLEDGLGRPYRHKYENVQQIYSTSHHVKVTNINMKRKVAVESVSTSYHEFRQTYFRSTSFTVGIKIPFVVGSFDMSHGYHSTLRRAHETISKKEGSIGISSDWWGMFSVRLGPTYLLKYYPLFKESLDKLVPYPQASKDQAYYNNIIQTFGTHYVSSIIVGGLANLYTHVTSAFDREYKKTEIERGISASFGAVLSEGMPLGGSIGGYRKWGTSQSNLTEEFKKNSILESKFIPAVIITPENEKQQWEVWKNETLSRPAVVNRTLSPLVNLLQDYPDQVQRHLQITIDYYLLNGVLPTISEALASKQERSQQALIQSRQAELIPGLDVVGCGFDIGAVESRQCLFDLSTDSGRTSTWLDVYNNDKSYTVPAHYFVSDKRGVHSMSDIRFFKTLDEFFQMSIYSIRQDRAGFLGFGASSRRKDIIEKYHQFYEYNYRMAWTRRQISIYKLSLASFPTPQFNSMTQLAIDALPDTFDNNSASNLRKWQSFFDAYGTHFVASSDMGGLLWAEDYFEECLLTKFSEKWVREQVSASSWFRQSNSISESYTKKVDKIYKKHSLSMSKLIGGFDNSTGQASSIDPFVINGWMSTVKNYPQPIDYQLLPIYTLLPEGNKQIAMEAAAVYFREQAVESGRVYIQRLKSHPNPPPLPKLDCSPTNKQSKHGTVRSAFDLTTARKSLCPVLGFRGTFCPGDPNWKVNFTDFLNRSRSLTSLPSLPYRELPKGVGMAIDMSTGNVLLPVVQLTYPMSPLSTNSWQDPHSGRIFVLPNEVTLQPSDHHSLHVNVSSYSTPAEFISEWLNLATGSEWSTSFVSNLQSILDIDTTYFSDDQGLAIAQNYSKLYNLRVEGADNTISFSLNAYAREAVSALTTTYDEHLYSAFLDAWGTHVAVETTVGGFTEKVILFQKCVNANKLQENIKEELLSKRPCISEDYHKWHKSFSDQRIGGNSILNQDTEEWFRTLAYAPSMIMVKRYVSWADIVTDLYVKENLHDAIKKRINNANDARREQVNKLFERRKRKAIPADLIFWTASNPINSVPLLLHNTETCGSGQTYQQLISSICTLKRTMDACATQPNAPNQIIDRAPISYERNLVTGDLRIIALRQYAVRGNNGASQNQDLVGNWVTRGCSEIINNQCGSLSPQKIHRVQLCTRCHVLCANDFNDDLNSHCTCASSVTNDCPVYPEVGPYQPYCSAKK